MITTKARTAANTATWENSAATSKRTQSISQDEDKVIDKVKQRTLNQDVTNTQLILKLCFINMLAMATGHSSLTDIKTHSPTVW